MIFSSIFSCPHSKISRNLSTRFSPYINNIFIHCNLINLIQPITLSFFPWLLLLLLEQCCNVLYFFVCQLIFPPYFLNNRFYFLIENLKLFHYQNNCSQSSNNATLLIKLSLTLVLLYQFLKFLIFVNLVLDWGLSIFLPEPKIMPGCVIAKFIEKIYSSILIILIKALCKIKCVVDALKVALIFALS